MYSAGKTARKFLEPVVPVPSESELNCSSSLRRSFRLHKSSSASNTSTDNPSSPEIPDKGTINPRLVKVKSDDGTVNEGSTSRDTQPVVDSTEPAGAGNRVGGSSLPTSGRSPGRSRRRERVLEKSASFGNEERNDSVERLFGKTVRSYSVPRQKELITLEIPPMTATDNQENGENEGDLLLESFTSANFKMSKEGKSGKTDVQACTSDTQRSRRARPKSTGSIVFKIGPCKCKACTTRRTEEDQSLAKTAPARVSSSTSTDNGTNGNNKQNNGKTDTDKGSKIANNSQKNGIRLDKGRERTVANNSPTIARRQKSQSDHNIAKTTPAKQIQNSVVSTKPTKRPKLKSVGKANSVDSGIETKTDSSEIGGSDSFKSRSKSPPKKSLRKKKSISPKRSISLKRGTELGKKVSDISHQHHRRNSVEHQHSEKKLDRSMRKSVRKKKKSGKSKAEISESQRASPQKVPDGNTISQSTPQLMKNGPESVSEQGTPITVVQNPSPLLKTQNPQDNADGCEYDFLVGFGKENGDLRLGEEATWNEIKIVNPTDDDGLPCQNHIPKERKFSNASSVMHQLFPMDLPLERSATETTCCSSFFFEEMQDNLNDEDLTLTPRMLGFMDTSFSTPAPEASGLSLKPDTNRDQMISSRLGSRMDNTPGTVIKWKRGPMLGRGAFGTVWCGLTLTGELVAVKQAEISVGDVDRARREYEKIQGEVALLKSLNHKNIVGYLGTSLEDRTVSIFMQYVPGGSLYSILKKFGPLEEEVFARYTKQILDGVCYLHSKNVIHRDIKGSNVMLMPIGVIKLIDFGCAKRALSLNKSNSDIFLSMKGTPFWMSPEVINGTGHGRKSDVWSVGCTVFEMATTKPPFAHLNKYAALFAISTGPGIPKLGEKFSQHAKDFVTLAMDRDPEKRPEASDLLKHRFILKYCHSHSIHDSRGALRNASAKRKPLRAQPPLQPNQE